MGIENVDKPGPKVNQRVCVTCHQALAMSDFSYFRSLSGRGSVLNDSCDQCAGILPPEVEGKPSYYIYKNKSKEPAPAKLVPGQKIVLDEEAITNLLIGVVAWIATKNTSDEQEVMGRLLVSEPKVYHNKQNSYGVH